MIKLYELSGKNNVRFSPYCWRARMALNYKKLDFQSIPIKFTEKKLIEFSNQKLLPVLVDEDKIISDSWNIAIYLDKKYPFNQNLIAESEIKFNLFINQWADKMLNAAIIKIVIYDITKNLDSEGGETREAEFEEMDKTQDLESSTEEVLNEAKTEV